MPKLPNSLSEPIKVFLLLIGGIIYWAIKTKCTCQRTRFKKSFKESGIKPGVKPAGYSTATDNRSPPEISEFSTGPDVPEVPTVSEVYSIEGHLRSSKTNYAKTMEGPLNVQPPDYDDILRMYYLK